MIKTARLLIRELKTEDAAPFAAMAADGSLRDIGFDKDCGRWMAEWIRRAKELSVQNRPDSEYLAYAVVLKQENTVIGSVGCSYYEDLQETGLTYFTGREYRNRGYAAEAAKAYADFFLKNYSPSKMIATIREENRASWRVAEKAGFRLTGRRMYQDLNDEKASLYRFYEITG